MPRLLNEPGARDLRTHETQSTVNDRIIALLGVPYLISDKLRRNARLSSAIVWSRGVISMSGGASSGEARIGLIG
jgi:hypothetical protein